MVVGLIDYCTSRAVPRFTGQPSGNPLEARLANAGRDQAGAMERLAQIVFVLTRTSVPVTSQRLLDVVSYGAAALDDRRRQLARDMEQLRAAGWDIHNEVPLGGDARYRLVWRDYRLRVYFAADEQAELQRVARLTRLSGFESELLTGPVSVPDSFAPATAAVGPLDLVLHAATHRCLLAFTYRGTARLVHPHYVHSRSAGWYLSAREDGGTGSKAFRVDRMSEVRARQPGSAEPPPQGARLSLDPVTWQLDPPVMVEVETTAEHRRQVIDMLGAADAESNMGDGHIVLRIPVTNRAAFRARLYELGVRVRLLGPDEVRDEVRAELLAVAAGSR